ncbi:hypothetical protein CWM47_31390 [Spirosoma pollinicola]|uniref:Uncharacterized protein n=1 Tax=Spirosoma pollinicola TaxID=2057025 RepID=A0A2K8Z7U4_9BACT|nr:hypothetical protein CWM47_31390 [Spirosoma pollinicola]
MLILRISKENDRFLYWLVTKQNTAYFGPFKGNKPAGPPGGKPIKLSLAASSTEFSNSLFSFWPRFAVQTFVLKALEDTGL